VLLIRALTLLSVLHTPGRGSSATSLSLQARQRTWECNTHTDIQAQALCVRVFLAGLILIRATRVQSCARHSHLTYTCIDYEHDAAAGYPETLLLSSDHWKASVKPLEVYSFVLEHLYSSICWKRAHIHTQGHTQGGTQGHRHRHTHTTHSSICWKRFCLNAISSDTSRSFSSLVLGTLLLGQQRQAQKR